jgi:hypothetical protein
LFVSDLFNYAAKTTDFMTGLKVMDWKEWIRKRLDHIFDHFGICMDTLGQQCSIS